MSTWYVAGILYSSDELYHHGNKGQKWGVRRFQNPDGTRTPAGKERYGNKNEGQSSEKAKKELDYLRKAVEIDYSGKTWMELDDKIKKVSGDFTSGESVSKGFKNKYNEIEKARSDEEKVFDKYLKEASTAHYNSFQERRTKIKEQEDKLYSSKEYEEVENRMSRLINELDGVVLRDLGYEDTKEARELIDQIVNWERYS